MTEPKPSATRPSRRDFLATSAGLAAFAAPAANVLGANDALNIGLIGTGGRCRALMKALAKIDGARMVAVCDIYDAHLDQAKALADPKAFATRHFPELLARKDVDAVLIASPDHWHVPMTVAACQAGKDVYVEKPLTHDLEEGRAVVEAQDKHGRVVQVGTQQRSMPHIREAYDLVKAGKLGRISKVKTSWNRNTDRARRPDRAIDPKTVDWKAFLGNAPDQPFDSYKLVGSWRWFWDFGGGLFTDLMVHWIDVAHWFLGLEHPTSAVAVGDFNHAKGLWETPDTVQTLLQYPGEIQAHFEGTFSNARDGARIEFLGTDATLYIDRGRYELLPERGKGEPVEKVLGAGRRGADFYDIPDGERLHLIDWIEAVRSRRKPSVPAEAGVSAASAAHLANKALRGSGVARWDG